MLGERIKNWLVEKFTKGSWGPEEGLYLFGLTVGSYALSSICVSVVASVFLSGMSYKGPSTRRAGSGFNLDGFRSEVNYHQLNKSVVERNLFNLEGEVPDESEEVAEGTPQNLFSEEAPCQKSTLNVKLLGIIYISVKGRSLVTLQEKGYNEADVYKEGEEIIGQEGVTIFSIDPALVVINNNGRKECLEPEKPKLPDASQSLEYSESSESKKSGPVIAKLSPECSTIPLKESYVNEQLGDGFEKMISSGRLIPHNVDGELVGFRLIGVKSGTIFTKMCLKTGDVITKVNQVSLTQPEQGFTFYEVFQNDREIRLEYLQEGKKAAVATVIVEEG